MGYPVDMGSHPVKVGGACYRFRLVSADIGRGIVVVGTSVEVFDGWARPGRAWRADYIHVNAPPSYPYTSSRSTVDPRLFDRQDKII